MGKRQKRVVRRNGKQPEAPKMLEWERAEWFNGCSGAQYIFFGPAAFVDAAVDAMMPVLEAYLRSRREGKP